MGKQLARTLSESPSDKLPAAPQTADAITRISPSSVAETTPPCYEILPDTHKPEDTAEIKIISFAVAMIAEILLILRGLRVSKFARFSVA
jgi:hypothetical protein